MHLIAYGLPGRRHMATLADLVVAICPQHGTVASACLRQQSATGPCAFLPRRACLHSSSCLAAGMVWLSKKLRRPRAIVQARAAGVRVKCWLVSLFFVCGFSVVVCAFEDLDDVFRAD
jgi:hypothetical protein